jgi:pimeloyl-ACP methyl ester carboxylesterase
MGMLAMSAVVALPTAAGTPDPHAILADYGKIVSANGIDESKAIAIGGIQQWITVLMFAGRYDYTVPSAFVKRWFDEVQAPSKRFVWFENSAHLIYEEEPGRLLVHLVQDALPLAAAR